MLQTYVIHSKGRRAHLRFFLLLGNEPLETGHRGTKKCEPKTVYFGRMYFLKSRTLKFVKIIQRQAFLAKKAWTGCL